MVPNWLVKTRKVHKVLSKCTHYIQLRTDGPTMTSKPYPTLAHNTNPQFVDTFRSCASTFYRNLSEWFRIVRTYFAKVLTQPPFYCISCNFFVIFFSSVVWQFLTTTILNF